VPFATSSVSELAVANSAPVPEMLRGCWRRDWIQLADGAVDDTATVYWLQLESLMADVRIAGDQPVLAARGSLDACSLADLALLAGSESSSGFTTCTPPVRSDDGVRRATAEWFTRGHGVAFQPVTAYPEPGLLEWDVDDKVMIERAPSGAYVERWVLVAGSRSPLGHRRLDERTELYVAGSVAIRVRDRVRPVPRQARLDALVAECGADRAAVAALVDCEFSVAFASGDGGTFAIAVSTLPWMAGEAFHVDL
jgi:hypothetical protein